MTASGLILEQVTVRHGSAIGCADVSLQAPGGRVTVLLGANGSGKSSVLAAAAGLLPLAQGSVRAGDLTLQHSRLGLAAWRRRVGLVMHDPDDQLLGTTLCEDIAFGPTNLGLAPEEIAQRVDRVLAALDLEEQHDASPATLSHGQKLRAAIAGVAAMDPSVVLLDEPTSGLDRSATDHLARLVQEMRSDGRAVLLSTHDVEFAWRVADQVVVLDGGRVVAAGLLHEVLADRHRCEALTLPVPTAIAVRDAVRALRGAAQAPAPPHELSITTKRMALASVVVCVGCCCGRTDRGRPPVPVDWLKAEFKRRRLLHHVHLTISGCLGPCDVPNVVAITSAVSTTYLGRLETMEHFEALVDWASASWTAGALLPLPPSLEAKRFERLTAATPAPLSPS